MSKPFEQGKEEVSKLCQYFITNREKFLAPGIKEAHIRQTLIDPFFESLGWDVRNTAMKAPQYREVVPEDSLEVEGHQKAPDYTFRIGPMSLFYVEAKKCSVNINTDPGPAYQLRRYAWRSGRIPSVPPFPQIKYQPPPIKWLAEQRQMAIIAAIPEDHRPIFLFLKYHLRRPGEACALKWEDWDGEVFTIRRGISARQVVESTKTGAIHKIPCHSNFRPILEALRRSFSPFIFTNPLSRTKHKNYTLESLGRIWKAACAATGESISLYAGLKHSTACQLVNDHGLNLGDLQIAGDWARLDSVKRYAVAEPARRKELLEGRVVRMVDYPKTVQQSTEKP